MWKSKSALGCQIHFGFASVVLFINRLSKKSSWSVYCKTFLFVQKLQKSQNSAESPLTILLISNKKILLVGFISVKCLSEMVVHLLRSLDSVLHKK